jgi:hypothetical protein
MSAETLPSGCSGVGWCGLHSIDHGHPEPPELYPPHFYESRDVTVKVDRLTLGAVCLLVSVLLYVWCRRNAR